MTLSAASLLLMPQTYSKDIMGAALKITERCVCRYSGGNVYFRRRLSCACGAGLMCSFGHTNGAHSPGKHRPRQMGVACGNC